MLFLGIGLLMGLMLSLAFAYLCYLVYVHQFRIRYSNHWAMMWYEKMDARSQSLGKYYGDFRRGLFGKKYQFDAEGVFAFTKEQGTFYNPTGVAECAIVFYDDLQDHPEDEELKKKFRRHIQWLKKNFVPYAVGGGGWDYLYDWHGEKAPWSSGIAQGIGISALLRAWQYDGDAECLEMAKKAFTFMDLPLEQGGKRFHQVPYSYWYEESNLGPHVLNGHIYSLFGVWDLFRVTGEEKYRKAFDEGCRCVKESIADFDLGFFTRYDNENPYPANNSYHYNHLTQFRALYAITGDVWFKEYADRFQYYQDGLWPRIQNFGYLLWLTLKTKLASKR